MLKRAIERLFGRYVEYHRHGPLMLRYLSLLAVIFFPAYYFIRFTKQTPVYDDGWLRMIDTALSLGLFLRDRWPERWKRFYYPYSYAWMTVTLPLTFMFTSLMRGGGSVAVGNMLMSSFLVLLLSDWRNTAVILLTGMGLGGLLYLGVSSHPQMPVDFFERFPILLASVVGGSLFKTALEHSTAERVRSAYAALAASIAHEMRNPLAQIKQSLDTIDNQLPQPRHGERYSLEADKLKALHRNVRAGELAVRRGLQVISMTLDEVNARPADPSKFEFLSAADVCAKAVQEYSYETEEQRARVVLNVIKDFTFRGDETAFVFVLFNLIKNSLYYLGPYPGTFLTIVVDEQQVRVRDNGPGISPEKLERLFEPFETAGKSGGTGLGLVYCRRVMRAFGGDISCASVKGEYTEFTAHFPHVDEAEREEHRRVTIAQARTVLAGKRILIVEDDPVQRMATRHKLGLLTLTAELEEAENGQQALQKLRRQHYDIVLLDLRMPGIDGYTVAETVRAEPGPNQEVRILAYTSEPPHLAREKALRRGMDGFVSKPCAQLPLLTALQSALQHSRGAAGEHGIALAGRRILVADDSAFNRKAVAAQLRNAGAIVGEAEHGQAVLDQLQSGGAFDAVLLDLHMPGMDGLEVTRVVRGSETVWAQVPVIALTASSDEAAVAAARAAGMNGFLVKPVDQALLYEELQKVIAAGPTQRGSMPPPPTPPATGAADESLLMLSRLESYRRLGMLGELINDYLPEMTRLVAKLADAAARDDKEGCLSALHTLLGMSGEAGCQALYRQVRQVYVPLLEDDRWPAPGWVGEVKALAQRSHEALKAYCATEAGAGEEPDAPPPGAAAQ